MASEEEFLLAILDRSADLPARLVYADWLEEQGSPRAELFRLQHALTQSIDMEDRAALEARQQHLLDSGVPPATILLRDPWAIAFALIPPGEFLMGSHHDAPGRFNKELRRRYGRSARAQAGDGARGARRILGFHLAHHSLGQPRLQPQRSIQLHRLPHLPDALKQQAHSGRRPLHRDTAQSRRSLRESNAGGWNRLGAGDILVFMAGVTHILSQIEQGDPSAADRLLPLVYDELRKLASHKLASENPGQTLQATALVHEAYLRLVGDDKTTAWDNRGHFFAAAAEAMRRILIDAARRKRSLRRGGNSHRRGLDEYEPVTLPVDDQLLDLDAALTRLAEVDPDLAELVKLRFFAGLTIDEAAAALDISPRTAKRNWVYARAWLRRALGDDQRRNSPSD